MLKGYRAIPSLKLHKRLLANFS